MFLSKQLIEVFNNSKSIAIVGAKDKKDQAVDRVGRYLIDVGFKVFPVHPMRTDVWGLKTYRSLTEIEEQIDIVNLFRAPEFCLGHAQECLSLKILPQLFWMQLGISNPEAAKLVADKGIKVVEDLCIMVEHKRLMPSV